MTADRVVRALRVQRTACGMTLDDVEAALDRAGIHMHRDSLARIEVGKQHMRVDHLFSLAAVYGTTAEALLRGEVRIP